MKPTVAIINYGMGNLNSVNKKLGSLNAKAIVTSNIDEIKNADKIILPGVGHFGKAMQSLQQMHLIEILNEQVLINKKPILGICLGMQLMAKISEEGGVDGLDWLNANVVKFKIKNTLNYKVPHTGWNQITVLKQSELMKNVPTQSEFYFVHSYHLTTNDKSIVLNETDFEYPFVSAVEKENIFGVQYHPEKSHDAGTQLLKNFINL